MQLLLVDADPEICATLTDALTHIGYGIDATQDGLTGLIRAETMCYDLILLDVMLPGLDGFSLCRRLRERSAVPLIFVSARHDAADRIAGLNLGADDYVGKPFSLGELIARVEAVLRRYRFASDGLPREVLTAGDLRLDMGSRRAFRGQTELALTPKDIELLAWLMRSDGQVLSRQTLQTVIWGDQAPVAARTVDVHIRWLREKVEPDPARPRYIETVSGVGYRINKKRTAHRAPRLRTEDTGARHIVAAGQARVSCEALPHATGALPLPAHARSNNSKKQPLVKGETSLDQREPARPQTYPSSDHLRTTRKILEETGVPSDADATGSQAAEVEITDTHLSQQSVQPSAGVLNELQTTNGNSETRPEEHNQRDSNSDMVSS